MKVEEVFGEEGLIAALAMQPVIGVRLAVGLVGNLLEELLATLLALVLLFAGVKQGVSLETGGVREGLGTFLTDVRSHCALSVIVKVRGKILRDDLFATDRTGYSLLRSFVLSTLASSGQVTTSAADQLRLSFVVNIPHVRLETRAGGESFLTEVAGN